MDPGPRPTDDEMDDVVAQLRDAGLLTIGFDADGTEIPDPGLSGSNVHDA